MKTIYIDRNFVSKYGFNKRLDGCLQHQELNPSDLIGLEFEPNFYETITNCLKYYKVFIVAGHVKDKCDIFISDNINAMDNNALIKILCDDKPNMVELIPYNNIYRVSLWADVNDIIEFYANYDIQTLERKEK